jgi:hypothetical protein
MLGAGLDIEGWSYIKGDVAQKINEMTDRSLILRQGDQIWGKFSIVYFGHFLMTVCSGPDFWALFP